MNDKPETKIGYVSPLKRICMTIGELPTSYLETMTYYEMLVWFTKFLQEKVIPTIDNNAQAVEELQHLFIELQSYVNNYFDNLDVQEEINNKLDQMVEDGVLEQIIEQYLNSSALWCFDNVDDMKTATNLIDGSYARTLGYYEKNDNGNSLYKIRNKNEEDIPNDMNLIAIGDLLVAELILLDNLNIKQFGAYGDGTHDDTNVLNYAFQHYDKIILNKNENYLITDTLIVNSSYIDGNNATIIIDFTTSSIKDALRLNNTYTTSNISNITINKGETSFPISLDFNPTGKIIMIKSDELIWQSESNTKGIIRKCENYNNGILYFGEIAPFNISPNECRFYNPYIGIVKNINLKINKNERYILPVNGQMCYKTIIDNVNVIANDGLRGISITGYDNIIKNCDVEGFTDLYNIENRTGYGILITGDKGIVDNCNVINCKHCISSGGSFYISENITYKNNYVRNKYDSNNNSHYQSPLDMHPSVFSGLVDGNTIEKENSIYNIGIQNLSGSNITCVNNKYKSNTFNRIALGRNTYNLKFNNNSADYPVILAQEVDKDTNNIDYNKYEICSNHNVGFYTTKIVNDIIYCNNRSGRFSNRTTCSNIIFTDNISFPIDYGTNNIDGVFIGDSTHIVNNVIFKNNILYSGLPSSSNCYRINIVKSIYGNNIVKKQDGYTGGYSTKYNTDETNVVLNDIED